MRMLFRIFIHTLKLCRFIIIQNLKKFHLCPPQKLGWPVKLREEFFIETAGSSVSMCSFTLEENVIACEEYGHLPSFLVARKESLVVKSEERQLYSQSGKVK